MIKKYHCEATEAFLRRLWHRANQYEDLGNERRERRMRAFYRHMLTKYQTKRQVLSENYIYKND